MIGVAFSALLLSLAGIPMTVGLLAKLYAMIAGIRAGMLAPLPAEAAAQAARPTEWPANATLVVLLVILVGIGVYPAPLLSLVRTTAVELASGPQPNEGVAGLKR
jgi:NADH:ubiquinone oxidoreductase subunit 2 (subunit N)